MLMFMFILCLSAKDSPTNRVVIKNSLQTEFQFSGGETMLNRLLQHKNPSRRFQQEQGTSIVYTFLNIVNIVNCATMSKSGNSGGHYAATRVVPATIRPLFVALSHLIFEGKGR